MTRVTTPAMLFAWTVALLAFSRVALHAWSNLGGNDFYPIWQGVHRFVEGGTPYSEHSQNGSFVHTPSGAVLLYPLGSLPEVTASKLYTVAVVLLIPAAFFVVFVVADEKARQRMAIAAAIFAVSMPLSNALVLRNTDPVSLALLAIAIMALASGRDREGGAVIGLAVAIKPTMVLLLLLPLLSGRGRGTVWAVAVAGLLNAAGFILVPDSARFFTSVVPWLRHGQSSVDLNAALTGVPDALGLEAPAFSTLVQVVAALFFIAAGVAYRNVLKADVFAAAAFLVVAGLVVPPYSFRSYGVYLILAAPFFLSRVQRSIEMVVAGAATYLALGPMQGAFGSSPAQLRAAGGRVVLAGLIFLILRRMSQQLRDQPSGLPVATPAADTPSQHPSGLPR
jgi:arabinofuranan 3-O-arabinosyltransferase